MNSEIQGAGILLTDLLVAYQDLPQNIQGQLRCLLYESSLQQQTCEERAV